jgi:S-adenosyl-L-methionine hydrolase (adenosine-forming)
MSLITLTTDFGTQDYYVGAMKGAILTVAPEARLVDLTHQIPPRDLVSAAFVLRYAAGEFPPGTVHLAVVDPGVGTQRRALAMRSRGQLWVGPDNGLFDFAFDAPDCELHQLLHPALAGPRRSSTFDGRDLFAPAAAHLCRGFPLAAAGPRIADPVRLETFAPLRSPDRIAGQVIHVDYFGNLVTNIAAADLAPWRGRLRIRLAAGQTLTRLCRTYAEAGPGELLALVGSADLLEISINGGSAARELNLDRRAPVTVEPA